MAFQPHLPTSLPRIIGHRGASGVLPELTLESFQLAMECGADAIELDLVATRDGRLIARHDLELSATTDVADVSCFASRRTQRSVEGQVITGWFAEDFTLTEIKLLRARQRFSFRDHWQDGRFEIPTLEEVLDVASNAQTGRSVAVYLELKHAAHHAAAGLPLDEPLLTALRNSGIRWTKSSCCIESFEPAILRALRPRIDTAIVQLIESAEMTSAARLAEIKAYADGVGVWKRLIVPTMAGSADEADESNLSLAAATSLVNDVHAAGLSIEAWTFRDELRFLAAEYRRDPEAEYRQFFELGVDGVITDFPRTAHAARARFFGGSR